MCIFFLLFLRKIKKVYLYSAWDKKKKEKRKLWITVYDFQQMETILLVLSISQQLKAMCTQKATSSPA